MLRRDDSGDRAERRRVPTDGASRSGCEHVFAACRESQLRHHLIVGAYDVGCLELGSFAAGSRVRGM